jgi:hypothetical protein
MLTSNLIKTILHGHAREQIEPHLRVDVITADTFDAVDFVNPRRFRRRA